jgi:hypothetical protein
MAKIYVLCHFQSFFIFRPPFFFNNMLFITYRNLATAVCGKTFSGIEVIFSLYWLLHTFDMYFFSSGIVFNDTPSQLLIIHFKKLIRFYKTMQ